MTKFSFSTTLYQRSHAKKPRGFGRWLFILVNTYTGKEFSIVDTGFSCTLSEAKKEIAAHIKAAYAKELSSGVLSIEVAP